MKKALFGLIMVVAGLVNGCSTINECQKQRITDYRVQYIVDNNPEVFLAQIDRIDKIKYQYK
jgi:hypothetical protein